MSVINKMLQELDRRNAVAGAASDIGAQPVKSVSAGRGGHEWFWRITAVLVLISVVWVAWVAYQLQPRTPFTQLALKPAPAVVVEAPKAEIASTPSKSEEPPAPKVQIAVQPEAPAKVEAPLAERAETFKLARAIETPISAPRPQPAPKAEAKKPAPAATAKPAAKPAAALPVPGKVVVDKRELTKGVNDLAETRFRRAAAFLNKGRVSEAEEQLAAALRADPAHVPARQAYVALLLEQQRVEPALRLLQEAVHLEPPQPTFSLALARIHVEQRDYKSALQVIEKAGPAAQNPEFQALRAAVLQRLGRHAEAVTAYQNAVQSSPQGGTWTGLGISLEAVGRRGEAAQAYRRALGSGSLPAELREYAEARVKALQ